MRGSTQNGPDRESSFGGQLARPTSNLASKRSSVQSRNNDDANLNLMQKQVRSLQLEKEKMRELIEELKQTNQLYLGERDLLDEKLKAKTAQLHKFASQCQANAHKIDMLEQVLADYKTTVADLASNSQITALLTGPQSL